jgi:hypothetical protein
MSVGKESKIRLEKMYLFIHCRRGQQKKKLLSKIGGLQGNTSRVASQTQLQSFETSKKFP